VEPERGVQEDDALFRAATRGEMRRKQCQSASS
jgi:hypothetical protein